MAKRTGTSSNSPKVALSADEIRQGVARIQARIEELNGFDPRQMKEDHPPELKALSTAIQRSIEKTFGEDTADCRRFSDASDLEWSPSFYVMGGPPTPLSAYQEAVGRKRNNSLALLNEAVRTLKEDLAELDEVAPTTLDATFTKQGSRPRRVFIVHGHDDGARANVARFLEKIGFEAVILHERPIRGAPSLQNFARKLPTLDLQLY